MKKLSSVVFLCLFLCSAVAHADTLIDWYEIHTSRVKNSADFYGGSEYFRMSANAILSGYVYDPDNQPGLRWTDSKGILHDIKLQQEEYDPDYWSPIAGPEFDEPGALWENIDYTFYVNDSLTGNPVEAHFTPPAGTYDILDIPYLQSFDHNTNTMTWDSVEGAETYRLRLHPIGPDGNPEGTKIASTEYLYDTQYAFTEEEMAFLAAGNYAIRIDANNYIDFESNIYANRSHYKFSVNTEFFPQTEPIPEPATMLLLGSGLIGLAGARRKLRKK